mmetsp:Transcript_102133/g.274239  ORF Transcript_102133/g.274239 Transcript_102133/m.274239 type:complete len:217 (-) Transcript_102133:2-652(-)
MAALWAPRPRPRCPRECPRRQHPSLLCTATPRAMPTTAAAAAVRRQKRSAGRASSPAPCAQQAWRPPRRRRPWPSCSGEWRQPAVATRATKVTRATAARWSSPSWAWHWPRPPWPPQRHWSRWSSSACRSLPNVGLRSGYSGSGAALLHGRPRAAALRRRCSPPPQGPTTTLARTRLDDTTRELTHEAVAPLLAGRWVFDGLRTLWMTRSTRARAI